MSKKVGLKDRFVNLKDIPIKVRLGMGLGLIGLVLVVVILLSLWIMKKDFETVDDFMERSHRKVWYASVISDAVHSIRVHVTTHLHSPDQETRTLSNVQLLTARATVVNALEEIEKLEMTERGREILGKLRSDLSVAESRCDRILELQRRRQFQGAHGAFIREAHPLLTSLHQHCRELITHQEQQTLMQRQAAAVSHESTQAFFILFALAVMIISALTGFHVSRSITVPLQQGVDIANRLAEGDLSMDIRVCRKDEAGQLLEAMKNMVGRLREAKDLEQQLRQSQKLETVGRLAGGIAHDFNNILGAILGSAELMKAGHPLDPTVNRHCLAIEQAVTKASGFVKPLLAFSRQQTLTLETVDIHALLEDFRQLAQRMIGVHIEFTLSLHPAPLLVRADASQLGQVLLNLLVNAREAMQDGGVISLETFPLTMDALFHPVFPDARGGEYVVLIISDTGSGMSPDVRERIFEPFYTTKRCGTGLGLSIVYGIIKQHEGIIDVQSQEGSGTTFRIFLPAVPAQPECALAPLRPSAAEKGCERILLVEDNEDVRRTTEEILILLGYFVITAADGQEGVEVFSREQDSIDLVLMDIMMPRMGGLDAYARMREIRPGLSALFVTGCGAGDLVPDHMESVAPDMIQKPFTMETLSSRIREILDRGRMSRAA